jgi:hypothetical protein
MFKVFDHGIGAERDATPEEIHQQRDAFYGPSDDQLSVWFKRERDGLLLQCDWTQLSDVAMPAEKAQEWKTYRQALRDITAQPGFPREIVWPVKPV